MEQVAVRGGDRRKRKRRKWKKKMKILRRSRVRECENRRETRRHKSDKDIENYFEGSFSWGKSFGLLQTMPKLFYSATVSGRNKDLSNGACLTPTRTTKENIV